MMDNPAAQHLQPLSLEERTRPRYWLKYLYLGQRWASIQIIARIIIDMYVPYTW